MRRLHAVAAPVRRCYTVWKFFNLRGESAISVRVSELDDTQHEYQRILWRGLAYSREEALANSAVKS